MTTLMQIAVIIFATTTSSTAAASGLDASLLTCKQSSSAGTSRMSPSEHSPLLMIFGTIALEVNFRASLIAFDRHKDSVGCRTEQGRTPSQGDDRERPVSFRRKCLKFLISAPRASVFVAQTDWPLYGTLNWKGFVFSFMLTICRLQLVPPSWRSACCSSSTRSIGFCLGLFGDHPGPARSLCSAHHRVALPPARRPRPLLRPGALHRSLRPNCPIHHVTNTRTRDLIPMFRFQALIVIGNVARNHSPSIQSAFSQTLQSSRENRVALSCAHFIVAVRQTLTITHRLMCLPSPTTMSSGQSTSLHNTTACTSNSELTSSRSRKTQTSMSASLRATRSTPQNQQQRPTASATPLLRAHPPQRSSSPDPHAHRPRRRRGRLRRRPYYQ